jgi:hypothetical protein
MRGAALLVLSLALANAGAQPARRWTSMAIGVGAAGATRTRDTVFQGSPHAFIRIGHAWTPRSTYAVEIEALGGRDWGAGDCIPGFTICAPPVNFLGASANGLWAFGRDVVADAPLLAGAGLGVYRVAPSESHAVSPSAALGANVTVDAVLVRRSRNVITMGLRGLAFPGVHGQSVYIGLLTVGFRAW